MKNLSGWYLNDGLVDSLLPSIHFFNIYTSVLTISDSPDFFPIVAIQKVFLLMANN